ncbi:Condensin complex subunit 2 [Golovinomyces cichoracearum]|uniref:Condensin complex subunit 2 n=1 Tax=Golovinomyces cichoracearum TaxID=62708 RepID=A0A420ITX8_9PEZI|nr:Condensin complex subunit 2 [Golovinomyces cichoracearum]
MTKTVHRRKRGTSITLTGSPSKSPIKIPLNDDAQEKAKRLQSRQALHGIQINQIIAAASPVRKLANFDRAGSSSPPSNPKTPRRIARQNELETGLLKVSGNAVTPMKRVPLLANFEEWMKMATDNKINATNSWNFALIDYFHDLSLLKEGDGVNFQKASFTLDGCVKIYTSRVDSVATETGKLLSGLADSSDSKKKQEENDCADNSEAEIEGEDGVTRKRLKKRSQRSHETTLANSFDTLRLKKFELEFSVDPLFKKASADFDEGGAKGLLLNHLSIDCHGRIVFDSSDDTAGAINEDLDQRLEDRTSELNEQLENNPPGIDQDIFQLDEHENFDINIASLRARFFPNLNILEEQDICPSLKNFDLGDPCSNTANIPFLKAPEDWRTDREKYGGRDETGTGSVFSIDDQSIGLNDDNDHDDGLIGSLVLPIDSEFGEGGEAWARDACIEARTRVHDTGDVYNNIRGDEYDETNVRATSDCTIQLNSCRKLQGAHDDILSYFDEALQKNWAGPEHWRIRKIKDNNKSVLTTRAKKEKEQFEINFISPLSTHQIEMLYTQASSNNAITMPKKERKARKKNLLPDDKHFNSKQLIGLFLKPKMRLLSNPNGYFSNISSLHRSKENEPSECDMNEGFWAQQNEDTCFADAVTEGNYDANFFQDNELPPSGDTEDNRSQNVEDPNQLSSHKEDADGQKSVVNKVLNLDEDINHDEGAFGSHLVTQNRRMRPEYVQFARVAKKVDVRKLKEELWKGIGYEGPQTILNKQTAGRLPTPDVENEVEAETCVKFTSAMKHLQKVYPPHDMSDISTSYCFICLLHLANEKGLTIKNTDGLMDLEITRDKSVEKA